MSITDHPRRPTTGNRPAIDPSREHVVMLADGRTLHTTSYETNRAGAAYLRICDPAGTELGYWASDEWGKDPEGVIGAILHACTAELPGDSDRPGVGEEIGVPTTPLSTRYGLLALHARDATRITLGGLGRDDRLMINNAEHQMWGSLVLGADGAWRLVEKLTDAPALDGDAESRRRAVEIRRPWPVAAIPSDSARRKAAIEVERSVNAWAQEPDAVAFLAEAGRRARARWIAQIKALLDAGDRQAHALESERKVLTQHLKDIEATTALSH
jgi:hypothetical protein